MLLPFVRRREMEERHILFRFFSFMRRPMWLDQQVLLLLSPPFHPSSVSFEFVLCDSHAPLEYIISSLVFIAYGDESRLEDQENKRKRKRRSETKWSDFGVTLCSLSSSLGRTRRSTTRAFTPTDHLDKLLSLLSRIRTVQDSYPTWVTETREGEGEARVVPTAVNYWCIEYSYC